MKRNRIALRIATMITAGAMILQLGPCLTMGLGIGSSAADIPSLLLDENGTFLGIFHLCGDPTTSADDLVYGCPVTEEQQNDQTGQGDQGG